MKALIFTTWPVRAWRIPPGHVARLRELFPNVTWVQAHDHDEARRLIGDIDFGLCPFLAPDMVQTAQRLRWVHSSAAAVEGLLPLAELAARRIAVTNSRGVQAVPMAEHVMGGLLVLARKYDRTLDAQREHRWIQEELSDDWPWMLHGRTMAIVGLGAIGIEVARRAHAFGMRVVGVRRRASEPPPPFVDRVYAPSALGDALRGADVLVVSAPGTGVTTRMIGAEQLALVKRGAILVNVARSQIVDQEAMRRALASGQLGGAVLDVFDKEPLAPDDPLWSMPNVVITPHTSGFRATHWDDIVALFADNIQRFQAGEPLLNVVDPTAGY